MDRVAAAKERALEARVSRAKAGYTAFGPSEEERKLIKAEKLRVKQMYATNFDKRPLQQKGQAFVVTWDKEACKTNDESSAERSVFVQSDNEIDNRTLFKS